MTMSFQTRCFAWISVFTWSLSQSLYCHL